MQKLEDWLAKAPQDDVYYIAAATDEAASYLSRYRDFFVAWDGAAGPDKLKQVVAAIAVRAIVGASGNLAPGAIEESIWERNAKDALKWLRDLATGVAELYVDWNLPQEEQAGHRACMSLRTPREGRL